MTRLTMPSFRFCRNLLIVFAVCLAGHPLTAQAPTCVLEGVVRDSGGGTVAGALVTVRHADSGERRTTITDASGAFRLTPLRVGAYSIIVEFAGFARYRTDDVTLTIGQTGRIAVTLVPAGVEETVAVRAEVPPIDVRQTALTATVDTERIEELPVQSRNYLNFALLAPGVVASRPGGQLKTGAVLQDSGFSFAGLRPRSNTLTIDGFDDNDHFSGGTRTELSLEAVREFQVVNNAWTAESAGAGGAVNVVTKSGANIRHGDVFVFGESGNLDARPKIEGAAGAKPQLSRFRAGGALGGPVVKDRTFFYAAVEREHMHGESSSAIDAASADAVNGALATGAYANLGTRRLTDGLFPVSGDETEWSAKLTHQVSPRQALMLRAAGIDRTDSGDAFNDGGLFDASARGSQAIRDGGLAGAWTSVIGASATNEARAQASWRRVDQHTAEGAGPGVSIAGVAEFGRPYYGNATHDQGVIELSDTWTRSKGRHLLKAGGAFRAVSITGTTDDGAGGFYLFRSLEAFLHAQPDSYRQVFGGPGLDFSSMHADAFLQEHWTPSPSLTFDAGVRFDVVSMPSDLRMTGRQISPRLGIAWMPASKWIVRGGVGVFADRTVLASVEQALLIDGVRGFEQIAPGTLAAEVLRATQGATLTAPMTAVSPSTHTVTPGTWSPSSRQVSVGVERELTRNLSASAHYVFAAGRALSRTINVNLAAPVTLTVDNAASLGVTQPVPQQIGRLVFGPSRLDPSRDGVFQLQPSASSTYHGLTVSLNRRLADEIEFSAAYTWSRAIDDASDFDEQPENPYALAAERATARVDQRHRFVVSALFDLPIGDEEDRTTSAPPGFLVKVFRNIEMAPIVSIDSGRPVMPTTGADDARSSAYPVTARPLGMSRNGWRLPATATVDLRVLKFFPVRPHGRLDVVVEAFNLLNRTNLTAVNTVYGGGMSPTAAFGRALAASGARRLQFSIDFEF